MTLCPTLTTERLTLRAHTMGDLSALVALFATDRAQYMDGPLNSVDAWRLLAADVALWSLQGIGPWGIERTSDGAFLGQVAITHPPYFPEPEIGWTLLAEAEGMGYAQEAAQAALDWAWDTGRFSSLVSYIDPPNKRSIALAERLAAELDPNADAPSEGDLVYRHTPATSRTVNGARP